jgi:hypothetical protein
MSDGGAPAMDENPGGGPVWPMGCLLAVVVAAAAMGLIGLLVMELGP